MPFVHRDDDRVTAIFARQQAGYAVEFLPDNHPDVLAYTNPGPTADDVGAERDRRLGLGFVYDFKDARGAHRFATSEADMRGWDRVTKLKDALLQSGATQAPITISTQTGVTQVTADEWNDILLWAAEYFEQPLWQASFILQAMPVIPADYATNPAYWPA
ncbi:hypothetical protein [Rhizobium leguminosarum]|uniref:hypothetical protein n=1 Tax=Rhizobium leguminosarum TaxID=384 RepID=UPI000B92816D|nr:hypothetical protein [Rhizobium leguminosarum]ASS56888.1 hypothetical protein CHR56_21320 [Rhizobium leguminosarum bv. viciae]